jgi:hypothetical protein
LPSIYFLFLLFFKYFNKADIFTVVN